MKNILGIFKAVDVFPRAPLACISRPRRVRSPQRVAPDRAKTHSRLRIAPSTRTISKTHSRLRFAPSFWTGRLEEVSYETLALETWRKSRTKRWLWRLGASLLEEVSYETLVLETWLWRKSRTKRSFWKLGASLFEEASCETLFLESWRFTFGGSLVRNDRFGDLALHFCRKKYAGLGDLALHFWRK